MPLHLRSKNQLVASVQNVHLAIRYTECTSMSRPTLHAVYVTYAKRSLTLSKQMYVDIHFEKKFQTRTVVFHT